MTHASLFSGIGGPELAAQMLGWDNLFHCEINDFCRKILQYWFPQSESYEDIRKTDFRIWKGKIDVLSGGFPCHPFSYAGKRRGQNDDRYLWPEMLRVIEECRPRWVVGENVAGITTMVEQGDVVKLACQASVFGEDDGVQLYGSRAPFTIQRVCKDLEKIGYSVQPVVIPACAVGAPHRRDRVFIIANSDECDGLRDSGMYERQSKKERIQEWDNVFEPGEPDKVRSEMCNIASDTDSYRRCQMDEHLEPGLADGEKPVGDGRQRDVAYTSDIGAGQFEQTERQECGRPSISEFRDRYGASLSADGGVCGERWQNFPTVSPVHRGNDGIPFPMDGLAVPPIPGPPTYGKGDLQKYPFSKWRTESLKAYGNAIVPQVMYEIFRFIQILEEGDEE